jgi:hypothetical protein
MPPNRVAYAFRATSTDDSVNSASDRDNGDRDQALARRKLPDASVRRLGHITESVCSHAALRLSQARRRMMQSFPGKVDTE